MNIKTSLAAIGCASTLIVCSGSAMAEHVSFSAVVEQTMMTDVAQANQQLYQQLVLAIQSNVSRSLASYELTGPETIPSVEIHDLQTVATQPADAPLSTHWLGAAR